MSELQRDAGLATGELIRRLNHLIAYDRAAVDACDAAAARIADIESKARVRELVSDHLRHVDDLSRCVADLGGNPTTEKRALPRERGHIVALVEDQRLLGAVLANEEEVTQAYEKTADLRLRSQRVEKALARAARHLRSHRRWLRARLAAG